MSRPLRIEYPGAWYHIMNRGRRSEEIFSDRIDYQSFIGLLKEANDLWKVKVSSYCLMPSHYHLLIETPCGNLSRFMRHIDGVYTQKYNRRRKYDGQLFRGRFKSILVNGDDYLLQLVRYIHRNPLRAKIVDDIDDYPWSSHIGYTSSLKTWNWLNKEFMLSIFSENKSRRIKLYWDFVNQEDLKETLDLFERPNRVPFWGDADFINWVKERFFKQKQHKEIPESFSLAPDIEKIIKAVCNYYGVDEGQLKKSRRGYFNEPRNVAIYLARLLREDTLETIGREFSLHRFSSVSSVLEKIKRIKEIDKSLQKRMDEIKYEIIKNQT